jgi:RND family efflux transporter MFP subunit
MTEGVSPPSVPPNDHSLVPKLSKKAIAFTTGGLLLLAIGVWSIQPFFRQPVTEEARAEVQPIPVNTLLITPQTTADQVELSGTIKPVEQAVLSTRVTGRIIQLSLEAGDRFRKGDILAEVNVVDIAAQASQARSGVTQAQAEVSRAQATLSQLQAQRLEAQAALRLAQINQARMTQLQAEGAVSQSVLDDANMQLDATRARVAQTEAGIQQAQAAIAQSQAAVSQAESGVAAASVNESYGLVVAPFDGVVVQKLAYEGEMAAPGTPLLKIENPDRLQLEISVPEENLQYVQVGQPVQVRVDAVNQSFSASVQQIVPAADPNSRSFLIKIPIPAQSSRIISGMFGRIALSTDQQENIMVPSDALIRRGQLEGVYVIDALSESPVALLRWVKTGKTDGTQVEITSGLTAGDRIITSNIAQLSDGQVVEIRR